MEGGLGVLVGQGSQDELGEIGRLGKLNKLDKRANWAKGRIGLTAELHTVIILCILDKYCHIRKRKTEREKRYKKMVIYILKLWDGMMSKLHLCRSG